MPKPDYTPLTMREVDEYAQWELDDPGKEWEHNEIRINRLIATIRKQNDEVLLLRSVMRSIVETCKQWEME